MAETLDLTLLTAAKAAEILGCDAKTFGRMGVPYVLAGKSKRYTRAILQRHIERSEQQCQVTPAQESAEPKLGRSPAKPISVSARAHSIGKSASGSKIIDFEQVAGLRIGSKPPSSRKPNGSESGTRSS